MAKTGNSGTRIWLAHYDLSGFLNRAEENVEPETPVVTTFSDSGPRRLPGNYDHSLSHGGLFDAATGGLDPTAFGYLGNAAGALPVAHLWGAYSEGNWCHEQLIELGPQTRVGALGEAIALNIEGVGAGAWGRGLVLRNATVTGTGNGTGRQLGAKASGTTLAVVFRVFSGTFSGITMKIQESSDDGGGDAYADVSGLTSGSVTAAGYVRVTTTAATEAWLRVVVSAFSGTDAVVGVTAAVMG